MYRKTSDSSGFFDAVNRAFRNAVRPVILVFTFVAGIRIDHINVAFGNRVGWTFGQAEATRRTFIGDLHSHSKKPPS